MYMYTKYKWCCLLKQLHCRRQVNVPILISSSKTSFKNQNLYYGYVYVCVCALSCTCRLSHKIYFKGTCNLSLFPRNFQVTHESPLSLSQNFEHSRKLPSHHRINAFYRTRHHLSLIIIVIAYIIYIYGAHTCIQI